MDSSAIYITAPIRTPIGRFQGGLSPFSAVDLGIIAAKASLRISGVAPNTIDETIIGHGRQAGCGPNPARHVSIKSGIPDHVPAMTVNQACASGMRSVAMGYHLILSGSGRLYLAGGMESMTNTPYLLTHARSGYRLGHGQLLDANFHDGFMCPLAEQLMGGTAENLTDKYGISRSEQDEYAVESQRRAIAARGRLREEIEPVEIPQRKGERRVLDYDEHPRENTTVSSLAKLSPVFRENGTVHAGNSSGITDGAAAMLVGSGAAFAEQNILPIARIVDCTVVGVDPHTMGIGPVPAVQDLLARQKLSIGEIDLVELNEAFAVQVLACQRELDFDMSNTNVNGGAIALGHPIGCSGARIIVTLLHEMRRRESRLGLATLCVSGGQGMAMLFESVTQ